MGLFGDLAKLAVGYALSEMENAKTDMREKDILKLIVFYYGFGLDIDKDIKGRIARLMSHLCKKQYSVDILETEINSIHAYINKEITSLFFKNMPLLNGEYKYFAESIFYYCSMQSLVVLEDEDSYQYFYNLYLLKKYFKFDQNVLRRIADTIISKEDMFGDSVDEIASALGDLTDEEFIRNILITYPSIKAEIQDVKYDFQDGVLTCSGFGTVTRDWMVTVYGKNMDKVNDQNEIEFYLDVKILKIIISKGINCIDEYAFNNCTNLVDISFSNSVTEIGQFSFGRCESLVSVSIPNSVIEIGEAAFSKCESLIDVNIPNGVTEIKNYTFFQCYSLDSINIPSSVIEIGEDAFFECESLIDVNIPNGVTEIKKYTFAGCESLTSINIPNSVVSIGEKAFVSCKMLKTVNYGGTKNEWKAIKKDDIRINDKIVVFNKNFASSNNSAKTVKCLEMTIDEMKKLKRGDNLTIKLLDYDFDIQEDKIGSVLSDTDFSNLSLDLSETSGSEIPDSTFHVVSISSYYPKENPCVSIILPNCVEVINEYAFWECKNLKTITLPSNLKEIGHSAFESCEQLTSIDFPTGLEKIAENAFSNCSSLKSITIPETVKHLGGWAFKDCENIKSIILPKPIKEFGVGEEFNGYPFDNCIGVEYVEWGHDYIPERAFKNCVNLKEVVLKRSVKHIGSWAFEGCENITEINLPSNLRSIGCGAFRGCSNLKTITLECVIPPKCEETFEYCDSLEAIYVPAESLERYKSMHWATEYYDHLIMPIEK